jgi:hypothetical protein
LLCMCCEWLEWRFGCRWWRVFFNYILFHLQRAPLQLVILHACRDHCIQYLHLFYSSLSSVAVGILSYSCSELFILLSEASFWCTGVTLCLIVRDYDSTQLFVYSFS